MRGVKRGGDKELTVEGGIEASQALIWALWPSSSGIIEMERDREGWRWGCQRKDLIWTRRAKAFLSEQCLNNLGY